MQLQTEPRCGKTYSVPGLSRVRASSLFEGMPIVRAGLQDMPCGNPREVVRASSSATSGAAAASKHASAGGGPLTIFTSNPPVAYLDSRFGITGSAPVTQIADQTANGHSLTVVSSGPSLNATDATVSNLQTVSFGAGKAMYMAGGLSLTPPFSYLYVGKLNTWLSTGRLVGDASNANRGEIACAGGSPAIYMNNGSYVNSVTPTPGSWYLFTAKFSNSAGDSLQLASGTPATGATAGNNSPTQPGLNLGGSTLATDFLMLLIFTGATPWISGELASFRTYLSGLSGSISV